MKKVIVWCCFLFAAIAAVPAHAAKPPKAVTAAFQQKFPNIKDVDWSREKNGEWEASFDGPNGKDISANFTADGKWVETETEIPFNQLPAAVQTALQGKKVKETARIERADGTVAYEAEVRGKDLLFDASGKML